MKESRYLCIVVFAIALVVLSGCGLIGPKRIPPDRFNYSEAIGRSVREQMLLNIVRVRYVEVPVFLAVSSVVNQYGLTSGLSGTSIRERPDFPGLDIDTTVGELNLQYTERPTVTYVPIGGKEFSSHLFSRVPSEVFFAAAQAGWPVDMLMRVGLHRFGAAKNAGYGPIIVEPVASDLSRLDRFNRAVELFVVLSDQRVLEVQRGEHVLREIQVLAEGEGLEADIDRFLIIADEVPRDLRPLLAEFRQLVGLSANRNRYRVTRQIANLGDDEITVQPRSVMGMIEFVSRGVEVPPEHLEQGRVSPSGVQSVSTEKAQLFPFRLRWSLTRPRNAYAAVRYQGYWYYIEQNDNISKRALSILIILYQLKAPEVEGVGPILTLPAG